MIIRRELRLNTNYISLRDKALVRRCYEFIEGYNEFREDDEALSLSIKDYDNAVLSAYRRALIRS